VAFVIHWFGSGAKFDFRARGPAVEVAVNIDGAKQSDTCTTMPIAVANTAISEPIGPLLSRKVKYLVPFSKAQRPQHRYRPRHSRREVAPCFGRRQMLVHAGSPRELWAFMVSAEKR
jgi:hypothetical protein